MTMNPDLQIEGLRLDVMVNVNDKSLEAYINDTVLRNYESAQTLVIQITPFVLRMQVKIAVLDFQAELVVSSSSPFLRVVC